MKRHPITVRSTSVGCSRHGNSSQAARTDRSVPLLCLTLESRERGNLTPARQGAIQGTGMSPETSFAALVKGRRTALGLSQTALAELVGRSSSAIRSWERGASTPTDENVVRSLAAVLGVDEATMRSSVGMPPDVPIEAPEVVGGDALEVFEEEIASEKEDIEEGGAPQPREETEGAPPDEPLVDDVYPEAPGVEDVADLRASGESEDAVAAPVEDVPAAPVDEVSVAEEGTVEDTDAPAAVVDGQPYEDEPDAGVIAVPPPGEPAATGEPVMPAAISQGSSTMAIPVASPPPQPVEPSYLDDPDQMMTYWIRAAMTVALTVFLLIVLFWALGRLGDSIGEVWDIFKAGA